MQANGVATSVDADVNFWLGLKARSLKLEIVAVTDRPGGESVIFKAECRLPNGETESVTDAQGWRKQGDQWRVVGVEGATRPT